MGNKVPLIVILVILLAGGGYLLFTRLSMHVDTMLALEEGFGIVESEVTIGNGKENAVRLHPGGVANVPLTIINGNDMARNFTISLQQPDLERLKPGYEAFPEDCYGWVTIPEENIELKPGEHRQLLITVAMPREVGYQGKHMELRVRVSGINPYGLIQLAVESRWYIVIAEA